MLVKTDKGSFIVYWGHRVGVPETNRLGTSCSIHEILNPALPISTPNNISIEPLYIAFSKCAPSDQYCRNTGRKRSLCLAMKDHKFFPIEIRRKFWEAYFAMTHQVFNIDSKKRIKTPKAPINEP